MDKKTIYKKLHQAWKESGYVPKHGQFQGANDKERWKYVTAEDIVSHVREAILKAGLVMTVTNADVKELSDHETKYGARWYRFLVTIKITIIDSESGETVEGEFTGLGMDGGDKAIAKGYTMALKYALRQMFLIETGEDDPDREKPEERPAQSEPTLKEFAMQLPETTRHQIRDHVGPKMADLKKFCQKYEWQIEKIVEAAEKRAVANKEMGEAFSDLPEGAL